MISSNWLVLFDFNAGDKVVEQSLGNGNGYTIRKVYDIFDAPSRTKNVYSRKYKSRRNNPLETLLETSSKKLLDDALPNDCVYLHVTFKNGIITVVPVQTHKAIARKSINKSNMFNLFAICTSGVDTYIMESNGFLNSSVIEHYL